MSQNDVPDGIHTAITELSLQFAVVVLSTLSGDTGQLTSPQGVADVQSPRGWYALAGVGGGGGHQSSPPILKFKIRHTHTLIAPVQST